MEDHDDTKELPPAYELGPSEEEIEVLKWRLESLRALGFDEALAMTLATDFPVDLGEARKLIKDGCPPELAARILV